MQRRTRLDAMPPELELAIGLVWGHLNAYQYDQAWELARGCLQLWPSDEKLRLMCDHAAAEVMEPVDTARLRALRSADNGPWVDLVLRRAHYQTQGAPGVLSRPARGNP